MQDQSQRRNSGKIHTIEGILAENKSWGELSLRDKLLFFDLWLFVSILGNFLQVFGCILAIFQTIPVSTNSVVSIKEIFLGLGCFAAWVKLASYFEYGNRNAYLMTNTLKYAFPNILKFIFGILPLIFGYVYLGRCLFWRYQKFESASQTFVTLFSFMAGDSVRDGFTDTWAEGFWSKIYLFTFNILFISAVHNVFIGIICEAFDEQRQDKGYEGPSATKSRKAGAWKKFEREFLEPEIVEKVDELQDKGGEAPVLPPSSPPIANLLQQEEAPPTSMKTREYVVNFLDDVRRKALSIEEGKDLAAMEYQRNVVLKKIEGEVKEIDNLLDEMGIILKDSKYIIPNQSEQTSLRISFVRYARVVSNKIVQALNDLKGEPPLGMIVAAANAPQSGQDQQQQPNMVEERKQ